MSLSRSLMLHADRGSVERGRQAGTGEVPWDCIASSCTLEFWLISTRHFHFLNNTSAVGWRLAEHLEVCFAERKEQALMTLDIKLTFMKTCAIRCYWMGCYWILLYGTDRDVPFMRPFFFISPTLMQYIQLKLKFKWEVLLPFENNANFNRYNFHQNQEFVCLLLQPLVWIHWCSL